MWEVVLVYLLLCVSSAFLLGFLSFYQNTKALDSETHNERLFLACLTHLLTFLRAL